VVETNDILVSENLPLIVFRVGTETYGVDISKVREVNRLGVLETPEKMPAFVEGVMSLRTHQIPIVDLRKQFGLALGAKQTAVSEKRIMTIESGGILLGFLVDAVSEVVRIHRDQISAPPPLLASRIDRKYIKGVVSLDWGLLISIDIDNLFSDGEREELINFSNNTEKI
jgi:purine-binding chemotaxis protein CheW